jgi:hypothetical protein
MNLVWADRGERQAGLEAPRQRPESSRSDPCRVVVVARFGSYRQREARPADPASQCYGERQLQSKRDARSRSV